ncbi:MAG: DUF971 domain-containing protein [Alphaproteobacteria bacterium]|nr:DUF971 domain-containing protein [Alphaproteobacteria bacterium]
MEAAPAAWPVELRVDGPRTNLTIAFDNGERFTLSAEYLRVESPSAEVQGHTAAQKQIIGGKRAVTIKMLEPVGNYAVRIHFSDGHDSGLYSWVWLLELGRGHGKKWEAYLKALKEKRLSRDA